MSLGVPVAPLATLLIIGSAAAQSFTCPTNSAGCDSYKELLKANDQTITSSDVRYACFRDYSDEFFIIRAFTPYLASSLWWKWNPRLAEYVAVPYGESPEASLEVATFNNGVEDDSHMPYIYARDKWISTFSHSLQYFGAARRFDSKTRKWVRNPDSVVTVDDNQVSLTKKYEAQSGKKVAYTLTMQRSTKRFTENFNVIGDAKSSSENSGRCVEINPMPTLPDPPPVTEEQKDAQEKREFCADFSSLSDSDRGYCNSPSVYIDDYEAAQKKKAIQKKVK